MTSSNSTNDASGFHRQEQIPAYTRGPQNLAQTDSSFATDVEQNDESFRAGRSAGIQEFFQLIKNFAGTGNAAKVPPLINSLGDNFAGSAVTLSNEQFGTHSPQNMLSAWPPQHRPLQESRAFPSFNTSASTYSYSSQNGASLQQTSLSLGSTTSPSQIYPSDTSSSSQRADEVRPLFPPTLVTWDDVPMRSPKIHEDDPLADVWRFGFDAASSCENVSLPLDSEYSTRVAIDPTCDGSLPPSRISIGPLRNAQASTDQDTRVSRRPRSQVSAWSGSSVGRKTNASGRGRVSKTPSQALWRVNGGSQFSRTRFDKESRLDTAMTRRRGVCKRCRLKKWRCGAKAEPWLPCDRCAAARPGDLSIPCTRVELVDIKLFRLGTAEAPIVLQRCNTEPLRQVQVTQDLNKSGFKVNLSQFQPGPGDETAYKWRSLAGDPSSFDMPPFCIADMTEAGEGMLDWFHSTKNEWPEALLGRSSSIVKKSFAEAVRYWKANKSQLIQVALDFWSASRLIERTWLICGDDLLGFKPITGNLGPFRHNRMLNATPVTPAMDTQLDELSNRFVLLPLKEKLLNLLQNKILGRKKEDWYEIFLATFLTLSNEEAVLEHADKFAWRFCIDVSARDNTDTSLSYAYYHACKTLLAYYHFAAGGASPFSAQNLEDGKQNGIFDAHQYAYLSEIREEVRTQSSALRELRNGSMYDTHMFWTHQVFDDDWQPGIEYQREFKEITEKDFLFT